MAKDRANDKRRVFNASPVAGAMNVAHDKPYQVKDATKGGWTDTATATDYANDTYKASKW